MPRAFERRSFGSVGQRVTAFGDGVVLRADRGGLITLAKHLLALAQDAVLPGSHIHYDAGGALDDGSTALVIERL